MGIVPFKLNAVTETLETLGQFMPRLILSFSALVHTFEPTHFSAYHMSSGMRGAARIIHAWAEFIVTPIKVTSERGRLIFQSDPAVKEFSLISEFHLDERLAWCC